MGKNSQIHLLLETPIKERLTKEAEENEISLSELCRQKLSKSSQLSKIELKLEGIEKIVLGLANSCT